MNIENMNGYEINNYYELSYRIDEHSCGCTCIYGKSAQEVVDKVRSEYGDIEVWKVLKLEVNWE